VTYNLDRGYRQCTNETVRVHLSDNSVIKDGQIGGIHQRGESANPLFRKILQVSRVFPRFCGCPEVSRNCNQHRINNLYLAGRQHRGSIGRETTANSLFQNILQVSRVFPIFCGDASAASRARYRRINILTPAAKKRGRGHSNGPTPEWCPSNYFTSKL
jgi:hypothetical protein